MKNGMMLFCLCFLVVIVGVSLNAQTNSASEGARTDDPSAFPTIQTGNRIEQNPVLIVQDQNPWGLTSIQQILTGASIGFDMATSAAIPDLNLGPYELVIIPSVQPNVFYTAFNAHIAKFENYVIGGGKLWMSGCVYTGTNPIPLIPGGVVNTHLIESYNVITEPGHPWVAGVPDPMYGTYASHNYMTNLPAGTVIVTSAQNSGEATLIEYSLGAGHVAVTGQPLEFAWHHEWDGAPILPQSLLYMFIFNPQIVVTPSSFEETLWTGETSIQVMTISNTGEGNLEFVISVENTTVNAVSASVRGSKTMERNDYTSAMEAGDRISPLSNEPRKGEEDYLTGSPQLMDSGGPDAFGYRWMDSNSPGGPEFNWIDIRPLGATPLLLGLDQNAGPFPIGFDFPFYENTYNSIRICSNGFLSFTSTSVAWTNTPIPSPAEPNNALYPFWDDFYANQGGTQDTVYYYTDTVHNRFIVQYQNYRSYANPAWKMTFQTILYPGGRIVYQYKELIGNTESATVGIENADGTVGLQVVYNAPYLEDELAIRFENMWLIAEPAAGTVPSGEMVEVELLFDAIGLDAGQYTADILIHSNDSGNPVVTVPAVLTVNVPTPPGIVVTPSSFDVAVEPGGIIHRTLTIENIGESLLSYWLSAAGVTPAGMPLQAIAGRTWSYSEAAPIGPASVRSPEGRAAMAAGIDRLAWTGAQSMPDGDGVVRYAHAQCADDMSNFYVISGVNQAFSTINKVWRYNTVNDQWTELMSIPTGQEGISATCYNGYIYAVGGGGTNQFYIYDIAANNWSPAPALPRDVWGAAVGAHDGYLYMVGGSSTFSWDNTSDQVNIYDIAAGNWIGTGMPMPTAAVTAGFVQADNYLYVVGGWGDASPGQNINQTQRYNMSNNSWETGPVFTSARSDMPLALTESHLYTIGGDANGGGPFDATSVVEKLDHVAWPGGSWEAATSLPGPLTAQKGGFCTVQFTGGEIWSVGGYTGSAIVGTNQYLSAEGCFTGSAVVPWLSMNPTHGTVGGNGTESITVTFDATDLEEGIYYAEIRVSNNDPDNSLVIVPVTLMVDPTVGVIDPDVPVAYILMQNYPNPFNPSTTIRYGLPERSSVKLEIYNTLGQRVAVLVNAEVEAGYHDVTFDAASLTSGVYIYRLQAGNFVESKKLLLLK